MSVRHLKPLAAVVAVGAPALVYYRYKVNKEQFDIPVRAKGPDGKSELSSRTFSMLPMKVLDARMAQNASAHIHSRPGFTWKHTTASLASNDPLEDANANAIITRDASDPAGPGDLLFFAVMDGHGGFETSQLLSKVIIKAVALKLSTLNSPEAAESKSSWWNGWSSLVSRSPASQHAAPGAPGDSDPQRVMSAIKDAFTELDQEIINAPLRVLAGNIDEESRKKGTIPDLSKHPLAMKVIQPAISGMYFHDSPPSQLDL